MDDQTRTAVTSESRYGWRLPCVVLAIALLCDLTLYRGHGFGGLAALFAGLPLLMMAGRFRPRHRLDLVVVGGMLLVAAARMAWNGNLLLAAVGVTLVAAWGMILSGLRPYLPDLLGFVFHLPIAGMLELAKPREWRTGPRPKTPQGSLLSVTLPLIALGCFAGLFTLANPNLREFVAARLTQVSDWLGSWFRNIQILEIWFWAGVIWLATGALRPLVKGGLLETFFEGTPPPQDDGTGTDLYPAYRNTLSALVALFAVYLVFEFRTLWFREFPKGFHYSGYAHEGAFWLTVALALATLILSLMFRGRLLDDPRTGRLQRLAQVWSLQNFLLAVTAYHRLTIYIGFNGMTWMRFVGFYGITAVVLGLVLVLVKIARRESFPWLVQRQLWVLGFVIFAFSVTPVDGLAMRYNTRRILAGDPAPSVQISVHAIDAEGLAAIVPLLDAENSVIRQGIRARLARASTERNAQEARRAEKGWTTWQGAEVELHRRLEGARDRFRDLEGTDGQETAWEAFRQYAYQWY